MSTITAILAFLGAVLVVAVAAALIGAGVEAMHQRRRRRWPTADEWNALHALVPQLRRSEREEDPAARAFDKLRNRYEHRFGRVFIWR